VATVARALTLEVHGHVDLRFASVRDVFRENFARGELGAACAVLLDGRAVVDVWGGWADFARTRPWTADTIVNAYSVGKPLVALEVLQLIGSGDLELDAPATQWWPELLAGRQGATVRQILCHRAGVPAVRRRLTNRDLWEWDAMERAVADTEPWWSPGTRHAYHTNTYGFLVGELARRVTGETPGRWLRERIAAPLDADVAWGVRTSDLPRCADVVWRGSRALPGEYDWATLQSQPDETAMIGLSYFNPPGLSGVGVVNTDQWRATEVPSTNLHATAKGVARVYAALAAGGTFDRTVVVDADVLAEAVSVQSEGWCPVLERDVSFGLGFQPTRPDRCFGPNPGSFGHFGTGGAVGFADPDAHLAFGYVMNAVRPRWQNERNRALVDAVYACL
jgi:CubicO group peptidase (beta-lactamase class C family)